MKKINQHPQIIPILEILPVNEKGINKYLGKLKLNKIKIIFFGSDHFVIPILQALEDNFEVTSVVTAPNSAVAHYFKGLVLTPDKLDFDFLTSHLPLLTADLFVVASFGKIIPRSLLNIPKFGVLNVHPSLLPKGRGPSPVPATILAGEKLTGVTVIKMDEEVDHGPIVATKVISLTGQENFLILINKLFQLGADLLIEIIPDLIAGKVALVPQNHAKATFTKTLKKEDGYFDINNPPAPEILDKIIRAYYPWPGVWTKWNGKIVKFLPGGLIQMEGKKPISVKDFINGYPNFPLKELPQPYDDQKL